GGADGVHARRLRDGVGAAARSLVVYSRVARHGAKASLAVHLAELAHVAAGRGDALLQDLVGPAEVVLVSRLAEVDPARLERLLVFEEVLGERGDGLRGFRPRRGAARRASWLHDAAQLGHRTLLVLGLPGGGRDADAVLLEVADVDRAPAALLGDH